MSLWTSLVTKCCLASGSGDVILLAADGLVFDVSSARLWYEISELHVSERFGTDACNVFVGKRLEQDHK